MRIKVKMIGSGKKEDPYRVDLPTWNCIEFDTDDLVIFDSKFPDPNDPKHIWGYVMGLKPPNAFAVIEVPDDECTEDGLKVSAKAIAEKYRLSPKEKEDKQKGKKVRRDWEIEKPDIGKEVIE